MTISLVASDTSVGSGGLQITLSSTEGNLQIIMFGHRTSSLTPSIDGDGWSAPFLVETEIGNASARRALVMYWRVVPAMQQATVTADFSSSTAKAGVGYEYATDTAGGSWSFDSGTGRNSNDSATGEVTSLASNSVTPEFDEAVALGVVITRHGLPESEDSYSDSFTTGVGEATGTGAANIAAFSGHRIVDTTPASTSTTASWTTSAMATSIIAVWSVDTGSATPEVTASIPLTLGVAATATATHQAQASIPLTLDLDAAAQVQHDVSAALPLTLDLTPTTQTPGVESTYISLEVGPMREPLQVATMRDPLQAGAISGIEPVTVGAIRDTTPTVGVLRDDSSPTVGVLREPLTVDTMRDPLQVDELRE